MADPASLALGVIPLVGVVIKSYKEVYSKLKTFRHCSSTVQRVQKKLKFQRRVFENECHLLLRFVLDDDSVVADMKSDSDHDNWKDKGLDRQMRERLSQNYKACLQIVEDIRSAIEGMAEELRCFHVLAIQDGKGKNVKSTLKRVRDGVKVAFNKTKYDEAIDDLRNSNIDLKGLREQINELRQPRQCDAARSRALIPKQLGSLNKTRRASKALYEALIQAWSCSEPSHLHHLVKLFVDTESVEADVQMNLAIYHGDGMNLVQASLVQLQVRCQNLGWIEAPRLLIPGAFPDPARERPRKRMKAVRFDEACSRPPPLGNVSCDDGCSPPGQQYWSTSCDLRHSKDICSELTRKWLHQSSGTDSRCLGYIDIQLDENFRHSFYPVHGKAEHGMIAPEDLITADQIFDLSTDGFLSTIDKLKLARSLVSLVLKFHSTPWLGEYWRLQDISFFRRGKNLPASLQTLHLGVEFAQSNTKQIGSSMEGVMLTPSNNDVSQASEDEQNHRIFCGIHNMTLHSLGVALLQIDRWTRVELEDVLKVRKMAMRASLGPRYQEITQKCLACDFGYGWDLARPQLQRAVYDDVVGALETMISSLDIKST
ncbi:hypothetical protein DL98DRAFT_503310 [Cadophora sp. DSE1049]|nr:hypothetical protein DL98DRAFT_503310 [Cadophora sp. DSE1049]